MFEIKGYAFMTLKDGLIHRIELKPGLIVNGWAAAHELLKNNRIEHYLIILKEVKA